MTKFVGPTFSAELAAAGITSGIWQNGDGTLSFGPAITPDQQQAAQQVFDAHDPSKQLPSAVTGNQWTFALSDLGLSSVWLAGVAKSKASDQTRINLIARDTPLLQGDPLLTRVAANAGKDASGNALIDPVAIFAHAQGMPT